MAGLSPSLPLTVDVQDGFRLNKTYKQVVQQNFTNLLLTIPGERIMDPEFGVGLKTYLFELDNQMLRSDLSAKIISQAARYLPFIEITDITFRTAETDVDIQRNTMYASITYIITPLEFADTLDISLPDN
jgi:phage baseplate assembly protein W